MGDEVYQCPHCELRFLTNWELLDHLAKDHHELENVPAPGHHRHSPTDRP